MVKAIWAVACQMFAAGLLCVAGAGCSSAPVKETDSGGGPRSATVAAVSAPAKAPVVPAPTASTVALEYRMGAEDVLRISVWGSPELTLDVVVRPDGKISMPLVQDVQAEGLTAAELAGVLHQRLAAYIKDPQVSVIVTQVNAPKVYVMGNVMRPGPYPLRSDMSVLQALSLAGGFTPFASPRSIKVVRNAGSSQEVRTVNYYEMVEEGKGNYMLRSGDTIVVP